MLQLLDFPITVLEVPNELVEVYFFLRDCSPALVPLSLSFPPVPLELVRYQNHLLAVLAFFLFLVRLISILLREF